MRISRSATDPKRNTFLRGFGFVMLLRVAWRARKRHETARFQGILRAAGITILVNGTCDALLFPNLK